MRVRIRFDLKKRKIVKKKRKEEENERRMNEKMFHGFELKIAQKCTYNKTQYVFVMAISPSV